MRGTGRFAALLEGKSDTAETLLAGASGSEAVLSRRAVGVSIGGIRGFYSGALSALTRFRRFNRRRTTSAERVDAIVTISVANA